MKIAMTRLQRKRPLCLNNAWESAGKQTGMHTFDSFESIDNYQINFVCGMVESFVHQDRDRSFRFFNGMFVAVSRQAR